MATSVGSVESSGSAESSWSIITPEWVADVQEGVLSAALHESVAESQAVEKLLSEQREAELNAQELANALCAFPEQLSVDGPRSGKLLSE